MIHPDYVNEKLVDIIYKNKKKYINLYRFV